MAHEDDFKRGPLAFLGRGGGTGHVVAVPGTTDGECAAPGIYDFYFETQPRVLLLRKKLVVGGDSIRAYYLPWKMYRATTMALGTKADFFFTSHLTNCRFCVFGTGDSPTVAHVSGAVKAGNPKAARNKMEVDADPHPDLEDADETTILPTRGRRFSISEGEGTDGHGYVGTDRRAESTSAFLFGERKSSGWEFHAQVVKANMADWMTADPRELTYVDLSALVERERPAPPAPRPPRLRTGPPPLALPKVPTT